MSDQHYYTVGVHGPPTRETAPHGVMYRRYARSWGRRRHHRHTRRTRLRDRVAGRGVGVVGHRSRRITQEERHGR